MAHQLTPQIPCPECRTQDHLEYYTNPLNPRFRCSNCGFSKSIPLGIGHWSDSLYAEYRRIERERAKRKQKRVVRVVLGAAALIIVLFIFIIASILGFILAIIYALTTGDWIPAAIVLLILAGLLGVTIPTALFTMA